MQSIRLLHCADGHLDADNAYLGERAAERRVEVLRAFEQILDLCRAEQIPLLLIAGDLFDREDPDPATARAVLEGLDSLPATRTFLAAGNHDPASPRSPYAGALPDRVHVFGRNFEPVEPPDLPVRVWGASFTGAYCDPTPLPTAIDDGRLNLLLLHGDVGGSSRYRPIGTAELAATGMDYVALGHVHGCSGVRMAGGVPYAYPGCFAGQGFDEAGEKGVLLGTVEPGRANLEFRPIPGRTHHVLTLDLDGADSYEEAETRLRELLTAAGGENWRRGLYKVTACGRPGAALNLDLLAARLAQEVYFLKLSDALSPALDLDALARENSLRGLFVRELTDRLNAADPADAAGREVLRAALRLGLDAFETEVAYRAD